MSKRPRNPWEQRLRAPTYRQQKVTIPQKFEKSKEVVFKVLSHSKTIRGVVNSIAYNADHGGQDEENSMFDKNGVQLTPEEITKRIDNWNLIRDGYENFSKKAREATPVELREMPDDEKYYLRQSTHFMISFPHEHNELTDDKIHKIVQDAIRPMTDAGHHALYAIHRHQNKPHAHVVMKYRGYNNKRLELNPHQIQKIREHIVEVAKEQNVELTATRRRDRVQSLEKRLPSIENYKAAYLYREMLKQKKDFDKAGLSAEDINLALSKINERRDQIKKYKKSDKIYNALGKKIQKLEAKHEKKPSDKLRQNIAGLAVQRDGHKVAIDAEMNIRAQRVNKPEDLVYSAIDKSQLKEVKKTLLGDYEAVTQNINDLKLTRRHLENVAPEMLKQSKGDFVESKSHFDIVLENRNITRASLIKRQAPNWYASHGLEYELRRSGATNTDVPNPYPNVRLPKLAMKTNQELKKFTEANYMDPEAARKSFLIMAADNSRTAFWYANKCGEIFGELKPDAKRIEISSRDIRLSKDWKDQAKVSIKSAYSNVSDNIESYHQEIADKLSRNNENVNQVGYLMNSVEKEGLTKAVYRSG
ncbi:MAG: hypothetical protein COA94_03275 [Rickettsiales bacterium]|nr:MAG: hypothetical protein COA94_03275 [Rickettsiales bacterium]